LTSRSYPAGYGCAVGGYLCEGDSFVRDTGKRRKKTLPGQGLNELAVAKKLPPWLAPWLLSWLTKIPIANIAHKHNVLQWRFLFWHSEQLCTRFECDSVVRDPSGAQPHRPRSQALQAFAAIGPYDLAY